MGKLRAEQTELFCQSCEYIDTKVVTYEGSTCNHIFHVILTVITGFWAFIYLIAYLKTRHNNKSLLANAISKLKCSSCNATDLVVSNRKETTTSNNTPSDKISPDSFDKEDNVNSQQDSKKISKKWWWLLGLVILVIVISNSDNTTPKNGFSDVDICKAGLSYYTSTPLRLIQINSTNSLIELSYNRASDSKYFKHYCNISGNKINLTLGYSGDWLQNTEITFSTTEKTITIYERNKYSGDKSSKTFHYK